MMNLQEQAPLRGRKILITRAESQAHSLIEALTARGAQCIEFPVLQFSPPRDRGPLLEAIARLCEFHWLIFTSANGVAFFFDAMGGAGRFPSSVRIAVIGTGTEEALRHYGLEASIVPPVFTAEGLLEAFSREEVKGSRILIPRAAEAREVLPLGLRERGAHVEVVEAYRTVKAAPELAPARALLEGGGLDAVIFSSSSTVRYFHDLLGKLVKPFPEKTAILCIGPVTAETAEGLGYHVSGTAALHTMKGLEELCCFFFSNLQKKSGSGEGGPDCGTGGFVL
ncbi:MAG: uroporphyrinogen-III synthase [Candidatus Eremiobacteraeota bacterium]|nr:uroporphyrinogen-III synthase [Candidatus Eremiobacteraeota bacterium]